NNSANATTVNLALAVNNSALAINSAAGNITMGGPISNNNAINFSGTNSTTVSGAISGTGAINKDGNGTLTLTGSNSYNGTTTINAGVLNIRHNNALGSTAGGTIVGNATALQLQNAITITGEALTLAGGGIGGSTGALRSISGNNEWAGDITINGTLDTRLASDSGLLTISGNIITASSKPVFQGNGNITVSGIISGGAAVATSSSFAATSTLTLSGNNTFTGQMQINGGIVSVSSIKNFGVASGLGNGTSGIAITIGTGSTNGTLLYTGAGDTSNRTIQIGTNSATPASTDTGSATIQNNGSGALVFNAANFNTATNATSGAGANRTLTLSGSNTDSNTISGVIRDNTVSGSATGTATIGLIKSGAGTWVLSGNNTYTGATTINAGAVNIQHANALGTTAAGTTVSSGAALQLQGG
ncbi:MAG: beta strand repeat-containing protein, partial [Spartobacteria bacterium]